MSFHVITRKFDNALLTDSDGDQMEIRRSGGGREELVFAINDNIVYVSKTDALLLSKTLKEWTDE